VLALGDKTVSFNPTAALNQDPPFQIIPIENNIAADGTCNISEPECFEQGNCFCSVNEQEYLEFSYWIMWSPELFPPGTPMCIWLDTSNVPQGVSCPTATGTDEAIITCTWTPTYCQAGDHSVSLFVGVNCSNSIGFISTDIDVQNINRSPIIQAIPTGPISATYGDTVNIDVTASDPDTLECTDPLNKDILVLTQTSGPGNFVDNGNGDADFLWTVDNGELNSVMFRVSDGKTGTANVSVDIDVFAPGNYIVRHILPYRLTETFSSAATAQMILEYLKQPLTQQEIYDYGIQHNSPPGSLVELDPRGMDAVLGHFDPYDVLITEPYDKYDSRDGGNPFQGYNFTVNDFEEITEYFRDIAHWMDYPVPEYRGSQILTDPSKVPPAVPLFGSYNFWVVVNGFASDADPLPDDNDPFFTPDFTVNGFFLTDPNTNGIGVDTYITAEEAQNTYLLPIISDDEFNGRYVQVAEPPLFLSTAKVYIGSTKKTVQGKQLVQTLSNQTGVYSLTGFFEIIPEELLNYPEFAKAFEGTIEGKRIFVNQKNEEGYYIVTFVKDGKTSVAVAIDFQGKVEAVTWVENPQGYEWRTDKAALEILKTNLGKRFLQTNSIEFVWEPADFSTTPFKPFHQKTVLKPCQKLLVLLLFVQYGFLF